MTRSRCAESCDRRRRCVRIPFGTPGLRKNDSKSGLISSTGKGSVAAGSRTPLPVNSSSFGDQWVPRIFPPASCYLFAGDETAAAGVGQLARSLMGTGEILGVFESDSPEHDMEMEGFDRLVRVHRNGDSPVESKNLCCALRQLDLPQDGVAYIGGEAKTGQALRRLLIEEKGWNQSSIIVRPFWATGKPGLHH